MGPLCPTSRYVCGITNPHKKQTSDPEHSYPVMSLTPLRNDTRSGANTVTHGRTTNAKPRDKDSNHGATQAPQEPCCNRAYTTRADDKRNHGANTSNHGGTQAVQNIHGTIKHNEPTVTTFTTKQPLDGTNMTTQPTGGGHNHAYARSKISTTRTMLQQGLHSEG